MYSCRQIVGRCRESSRRYERWVPEHHGAIRSPTVSTMSIELEVVFVSMITPVVVMSRAFLRGIIRETQTNDIGYYDVCQIVVAHVPHFRLSRLCTTTYEGSSLKNPRWC